MLSFNKRVLKSWGPYLPQEITDIFPTKKLYLFKSIEEIVKIRQIRIERWLNRLVRFHSSIPNSILAKTFAESNVAQVANALEWTIPFLAANSQDIFFISAYANQEIWDTQSMALNI